MQTVPAPVTKDAGAPSPTPGAADRVVVAADADPDVLAGLDDAMLVAQAQRELPHDTTTYALLVRKYHSLVVRSAQAYLHNGADAADVAQEVFLSVYRALPQFEARSSFKSWLYRIVQNRCATRFRKIRRRRQMRTELTDSTMADSTATSHPPPTLEAVSALSPAVKEAMAALAEKDRAVLMLAYIGDLPMAEIASQLGLSVSGAKMRVKRARERLIAAIERAERRNGPSEL